MPNDEHFDAYYWRRVRMVNTDGGEEYRGSSSGMAFTKPLHDDRRCSFCIQGVSADMYEWRKEMLEWPQFAS